MKTLEVLLLKDVPKLGQKGSIVAVKPGYGRNYLLPLKLAALATKQNMALMEVEKKKMQQEENLKKQELKKMAQELELTACTIEAKANEENHLFGSVTYPMIQESFKKLGFDIPLEGIQTEDPALYPIKELGIFNLIVKLHPEITGKSKVWVVKQANSE